MLNLHVEIDRKDHGVTRLVEEPLEELAPGQVRFRIDRYAVTANTVTYAVTGDTLGYWDFFPAALGWGRVPAMGWAGIVASAHPEIPAGGRYYGWFPMARYLDVSVTPTAEGLRDDGPHRAAHAPVYRTFTATDRDPYYQSGADAEDRHALLRGLFITGFLAEDYFADHDYFGADRVLVISASSKTALGFACCADERPDLAVIGVTSARNRAFVHGLGCYDAVVTYDDIATVPADTPVVSIDMAGNGTVLEHVHRHFGDRLRHSMAIGRSHHDAPRAAGLPGPRPAFFFAPTQVQKRVQDWGAEAFRERVGTALRKFVDQSVNWLAVARSTGPDAAAATWRLVYEGQVPPNVGHIVSLSD